MADSRSPLIKSKALLLALSALILSLMVFKQQTATAQRERSHDSLYAKWATKGGIQTFSTTLASRQPVHARHPLDALTTDEYTQVLAILQREHKINTESRFPIVTLHEPSKADVLKWKANQPIARSAFAVVKQGPQTFEAIINLSKQKVDSWREITGVQPSVLFEEFIGAQGIALEDPAFQAGLAARGITDFSHLLCAPLTIGNFDVPEEAGRRLMRVPCFNVEGASTNLFARPIEGLSALVDLNTKEVVKVIDTGIVSPPQALGEFSEEAVGQLRAPLKPTKISQPEGSNVRIDGHVVTWDNWSFHQRLDKRTGLILSQVTYNDQGDPRSILYQGSLSEVFVPYMDPDLGWYYRTFMDAGEYGFGLFATPLTPGIDCPETATFLGGVLPDDFGNPYPVDGVICIFERNTGDPAWRHFETFNGVYEGRPAVELVVRTISTVGNYDYIMDWVLTQDAKIRVRVGATGIDITKGVNSTTLGSQGAAEDTAYGTLVGPNIVAQNHSHFFNFRLDMDVDGTNNAFELTTLVPEELTGVPRESIWRAEKAVLATESQAKLDYDPFVPTVWEIINNQVHGQLGHHSGYELRPLNSAIHNILLASDYSVQRAQFSLHNLWVTRYNPAERYAGGDYPNQSQAGQGLPDWTAQNRSIVDTDIVLWYTAGLQHEPHLEDWPVMGVRWMEFELTPHNFFQRNPALDLRER